MAKKHRKAKKHSTKRRGKKIGAIESSVGTALLIAAGAVAGKFLEKKILSSVIKGTGTMQTILRPAITGVAGYALSSGLVGGKGKTLSAVGTGLMVSGALGLVGGLIPSLGIGRTPYIAGGPNSVKQLRSSEDKPAPFINGVGQQGFKQDAYTTALFI